MSVASKNSLRDEPLSLPPPRSNEMFLSQVCFILFHFNKFIFNEHGNMRGFVIIVLIKCII